MRPEVLPGLTTRGQTRSKAVQGPMWVETLAKSRQLRRLDSSTGSLSCIHGNGWTLLPSKSSAAKFKSRDF